MKKDFPLEEIIKLHLSDLFYGMVVREIHPFRIIRDADIAINEEESASDLISVMKTELEKIVCGVMRFA